MTEIFQGLLIIAVCIFVMPLAMGMLVHATGGLHVPMAKPEPGGHKTRINPVLSVPAGILGCLQAFGSAIGLSGPAWRR